MSNIPEGGGFISINRKILEWEWYSDNNTKCLFIHCLLKANFKAKEWKGYDVGRGEFITSYATLANELNLTVMQIRTAFGKLINTNEILTKPTSKYTIVTVVKYNDYQTQGQPKNKRITKKQQTNNTQVTTTNNVDNEKKEIKEIFRSFDHLSITKEDVEKLNKEYEMRVITSVLDNIENFGSNKKYKNLYLTAKNWLKKEPKKLSVETAEKQVNKTYSFDFNK